MQTEFMRKIERFQKCSLRILQNILFCMFFCDGPEFFYENRFWTRRPDGIVINKNHRTLYILEFERSSDRNEDFQEVKEDEANEQN